MNHPSVSIDPLTLLSTSGSLLALQLKKRLGNFYPPVTIYRSQRPKRNRLFKQWAIFTTLLLFLLPTLSMAAQLTLAWNPNSPTPDGYLLFYRIEGESYNYTSPAWPTDGSDHTETTCTISGLTEGETYYFVVRAYTGNDVSSDSNEISYTIPITQNDPGAIEGGRISIEAENYDDNVPVGSHSWDLVTPAGCSGTGAMQATPNINTSNDTDYTTASARLDYVVNFDQTGIYYIWIRGQGASSRDDSLHVGIDGAANTSGDRISSFTDSWSWSQDTMDGVVATIDVATAGEHTINVWMREDGLVFDKIVLTALSDYVPQ